MKKILLLLSFSILATSTLFAAKEPIPGVTVRGAAIIPGALITLEDPHFNDGNTSGYTNVASKGLVTFGIDYTRLKTANLNVAATLNVKVTYYTTKDAPAAFLPATGASMPLTLDYKFDGNTRDKDIIRVPGAYKIIVEVIGSPLVNGAAASLPDFFFIQAEIETERYYNFSFNTTPFQNAGELTHSYNTSNNELTFTWPALAGAESYDLEYTYLDDYDEDGLENKRPLSELEVDFKNNSTRVTLDKTNYTLPYVYDRGYILYRVRGVGKAYEINATHNIYGKWSSDNSTSTANFPHVFPKANEIVKHENLNWQYSSSFAEEGKRKDVKTYFDGSLRNRQAVTLTNSDKNLIVGETVYDYIGRPAVNILPVPVVDPTIPKSLHYVPGFNVNTAGEPYSKKDFDEGKCITATEALKPTSGASMYYSPQNPNKDKAENAYIPDAEGFPFTQVEYEPDNSGRVRRQSGLGPVYKLGSKHETQYFYGNPEQEQLDRLFGSEVGYRERYQKNVVVDANGQASVSYLDPTGKVVATSLAGNTPGKDDIKYLDELPGVVSQVMFINLIEKCADTNPDCAKNNSNTIIDKSLVISKDLIVTSAGSYKFSYSVTGDEFSTACNTSAAASTTVCYDCIYDLELEIRDACGGLVQNEQQQDVLPIKKTIGNLSTLDNMCGEKASTSEELLCYLPIGNYTLLKKLTVNQEAIDRYVAMHIANCTYSETEINAKITTEKDKLREGGYSCDDMDCKKCEKELNDKLLEFAKQFGTSPIEVKEVSNEIKVLYGYDEALQDCNDLCEPEAPCAANYQMMLTDVSPSGQYGATDPESEDWPLSVFNTENLLPRNGKKNAGETFFAGNYKYPSTEYTGDDGFPSYVAITLTELPPADPEANPTYAYDPEVSNEDIVYLIGRDEKGNPTILSPALVPDYKGILRIASAENFPDYPNAFIATLPQNLKNLPDFISNWESKWGESLISLHPEYCYYEACVKNAEVTTDFAYSSHEFDDRLQLLSDFTEATIAQVETLSNSMHNPFYNTKFPLIFLDATQQGLAANRDDVDFLLARDPFFSPKGRGAAYKQKMHNKLLEYSKGTNGYISLKAFIAIVQRCSGRYHEVPGPTCTNFLQDHYTGTNADALNKELKDAEWDMYVGYYLAEKGRIQRLMADQECSAKTEFDGGFNACIGNYKFKPARSRLKLKKFPGFGFWRPSSPRSQPCGQSYFRLYRDKTKRFTTEEELATLLTICDESNPEETIKAAKKKAELENFMATGQCPIISSLELLVNGLAVEGKFNTATPEPLSEYAVFSQNLYDILKYNEEKETGFNDAYTNFSWSTTPQGSGVMATITPQSNSYCNQIYFELPVTNYENSGTPIRITYDHIRGIRNFVYVKTENQLNFFRATAFTEITGIDATDANKVIVLGEQNVEVTGYTCLPIDKCPPFNEVCEESVAAIDLESLLSTMATPDTDENGNFTGNDLRRSGVLTVDKYAADLTPELRSSLGTSANGSWLFSATATGGNISLKIYDDNIDDPEMVIALNTINAGSVDNIVSFSCIKGISDESPNFTITAWYDPNINDNNYTDLTTIPYTGTITTKRGTFKVLKCGPPIPEACKSMAHDNTKSLELFLNELLKTNDGASNTILVNGASKDISAIEAFGGLQSQIYELPNTIGPVTITNAQGEANNAGNLLKASFCTTSGTTCVPTSCGIQLSFVNKDPAVSFSSIIGFSNLKPDYGSTGVNSNEFIVTATYKSGTQLYETLVRGTSCFPIALCEVSCIAGTSIESHLENGDFNEGTVSANTGTGFKSDYSLSNQANIASQAYLLYDANEAKPEWRGRDHTLAAKKYFLAVKGETGKRAWYTTVSVQKDVKYNFTAYFKALSDNCAGVSLSMYGTQVPEANCQTVNRNTAFNIALHNLQPNKWRKLGIPEPWQATFTGDLEIGIMSLSSAGECYDFGVDDIAFDGITTCRPSVNIFPQYPLTEDELVRLPCEEHLEDMARENVMTEIESETTIKSENIKSAYIAKCLKAAEQFTYEYTEKEYHYTLYYYDQAGNLIKTLPPAAVRPIADNAALATVKADRKNGVLSPTVKPGHVEEHRTEYKYNALNQLVGQHTPDGGDSRFWYDKLGRLVLSQNAKQALYTPKGYSYSKFDALGRSIEVGEVLNGSTDISALDQLIDATFNTIVNTGTRREITRTYYDAPIVGLTIPGFDQERLRKRVASSTYQDVEGSAYNHATHYSYDIHGNVKTLIQEFPDLQKFDQRYKKIEYDFDLVSGKVNLVSYQDGKSDQFYHKYAYDADNRITEVRTSKDGVIWDNDASYNYYAHGPLARTELGDQKVQGMDYAYTLQGWIKGVNSESLNPTRDIGKDGTGERKDFAKDVVGFSLGYHSTDYKSIGISTFLGTKEKESLGEFSTKAPELFNGNISHMVTTLSYPLRNDINLPLGTPLPQLSAYRYDQLNRIKKMEIYHSFDQATNAWSGSSDNKYLNKVSYDPNGNILTMDANEQTGIAMDRMVYQYDWIDPNDHNKGTKSNKLLHVNDNNTIATALDETIKDIQDQGNFDPNSPATWNYSYDKIGNMIQDKQEGIADIEWTVYGKVKRVTRTTDSKASDIEFAYDATGNRIMKLEKPRTGSGLKTEENWHYTYYMRDASGNVMSIYEITTANSGGSQYASTFKATEYPVYGSSRVGSYNPDSRILANYTFNATINGGLFTSIANPVNTAVSVDPIKEYRITGLKYFELSNHLGNVLSTISDRKIGKDGNTDGIMDYYITDIKSTSDYYPFGMMMRGRTIPSSGYRYGFNGKEKNDELNGDGNSYDFGGRIYDTRLGRWMTTDPLQNKYPNLSSYSAFENCPLYFKDPNGEEARYSIKGNSITVSTVLHIYGPGATEAMAKEYQKNIMSKWKGGKFKGEDGKLYNIKFDVQVQYHSESSIKEFKDKIKGGDNVAFIKDDPKNTYRSNVAGGYYGTFSSGDGSNVVSHELGHMFGLADKYYDVPYEKEDPSCKDNCKYKISGNNFDGVSPNSIMGVASVTKGGGVVVNSEISAIGNKILSFKKSSGAYRAGNLSLDTPSALPPIPPMDIDPKQLDNLTGYGTKINN